MTKGWESKPLAEVSSLNYGYTESASSAPIGPRFLRITDIQDDRVDWETVPYCKIDAADVAKYRLATDDIVFARTGATTGKSFLIDNPPDAVFASYLIRLRLTDKKLSPKFVAMFFQSDYYWESVKAGSAGSAQGGFNASKLGALRMPLPPLPEQQQIVGILDEAFAGIATAKANAEMNLRNSGELFESHLHSEHVDRAFLGDLVDIKTGKLDANAAVEGGEYPFFTCSRDIFAIDKYAFDCEAILLAGNNAVGDFNVKHYKGKFNAYQRTYVITVNARKRVLYRFLYFQMLKSLKKFKSQSVGTGTKFLKMGMITGLEVALPNLDEQKRIVDTMDSVREETERLESLYQQKLAALDALKKSLLHQAFSGQLTGGEKLTQRVGRRDACGV
jgi:type I restriction enzyme, S subunit